MKFHIVMHESFESPGAIEDWAKSKKHEISYSRLYAGDALPSRSNGIDFLIVMGGPQSPSTTKEECPHFDAEKEIRLIKDAIEEGKLVLGVCLGAQLIGEALGAKVEHSPNREIGVFEMTLTDEANKDPVFSKFPRKFLVGHWHGDMPGLTRESKVLAISKGCPRQIVKYSPKVYGFQCHFEFTKKTIDGMIENCGNELAKNNGLAYVQSAQELRAHDYREMNELLFMFLDYMATFDSSKLVHRSSHHT